MAPPVVTIEVNLPENFTIDEAKFALLAIASGLNRMVGLALASGTLTAASPIVQSALTAAGHTEQAAALIAQQQQAQLAQSGIVQPTMRPVPMPRRTN